MKKTKYFAMSVLIVVVLFGLVLFSSSKYKIISVSGKKFVARTALTPEQQRRGLGGKTSLCFNCAMLFVFKQEGYYNFRMKDLNFDLDLLWIAGDKIVYLAKNVSRNSEDILKPDVKADKVLEVNSGLSDRYDFKTGDKVKVY